MIEERRQNRSCFDEEIAEAKATTPKAVLGSSPDEDRFCNSETKHYTRTA
jgi:hypothetical protein